MTWKTFNHYVVSILIVCTTPLMADTFTHDGLITDPIPSRFTICFHGSCEDITEVHLDAKQWRSIKALFTHNATARQERENIKHAIARMETMVGDITGTSVDKAGTYAYLGDENQLDCIDESTNTTFYLTMMRNDGLIRWHDIEDRATRGYFLFGWPHTTAVIRENKSQEKYAVDSWFLDNGKKPHILPLEKWASGWEPS